MTTLKLVARLVLVLFLAACGGGSLDNLGLAHVQLQEKAPMVKRLSVTVGTGISRLDQTLTGFFYPTGTAEYSFSAWWLAKDPNYFSGEYHLGLDITYGYGLPVYAVADGTVKRVSPPSGGWGANNCALAIEHKTGSGQAFVAIYGHLLCSSVVGEKQSVTAGQPIGTIGDWPPVGSAGDHLHFGIHPGPYSTIAASQWGRQFISGHWSDPCEGNRNCDNGMTDPIAFINDHYAYNPSTEKQLACQGSVCWAPKSAESCELATSWYKGADYPIAQQGMPWMFEVDSRACGDIRAVVMAVDASENPSSAVPNDGWWRTFFRYVRKFMGVETASAHEIAQVMANTVTINTVNIYTGNVVAGNASRAGNATGRGYLVQSITLPVAVPPDFITKSSRLETPWGVETYKYGWGETVKMKGRFENIGDGPCLSGEVDVIIAHVYLSKGYKEDAHSDWKRVGTDEIQCANLQPGDTHTETEGIELWRDVPGPGIYNIVWCIDHPLDDHNNGGDHREKHESNNCSTEAVFEVTANQIENVPNVDFTVSGFTVLQAPVYAGDFIRLGAWITNKGPVNATTDIRSSYTVSCNGGSSTRLTDDGTRASSLVSGASVWEEIVTPVQMPNVVGTCTLTFTADYLGNQAETDETNNSQSLTVTLQPRPAPNLVITRFEDKVGCCTTNRGAAPKPRIWIRNDGPVAPAANVTVVYQVSSPVATGGLYQTIGYGTIRPDELMPGDTDEDQMDCDGCWRIPNSSAWKKQWHTFRACVRSDGAPFTPSASDPGPGVICSAYARYSKS